MRRLVVLTEVFAPENFAINELASRFTDEYQVTVVTRAPSYPKGRIFEGFDNRFSIQHHGDIRVVRYPIFTNYNQSISAKIGNLLWQPIAILAILIFLRWDKLFIYQTGSLYSYMFVRLFKSKRRKHVLWSQDLWPEAGFEFGFPRVQPIEFILRGITKSVLKGVDGLLVQSQSFQKHYQSLYGASSSVIYNFVPFPKPTVYADRKDFTTLVYAGNIGFMQNLDASIELFKKLRNGVLGFKRFEIYGEGSEFARIREENSGDKDIVFYGQVPPKDVAKALSRCRFCIFSLKPGPIQYTMPSRLQFFYNSNVPVIYLGGGASAEFIERTKSGIVIESENIESEALIRKFIDFESKEFRTPDLFNKEKLVGELLSALR